MAIPRASTRSLPYTWVRIELGRVPDSVFNLTSFPGFFKDTDVVIIRSCIGQASLSNRNAVYMGKNRGDLYIVQSLKCFYFDIYNYLLLATAPHLTTSRQLSVLTVSVMSLVV